MKRISQRELSECEIIQINIKVPSLKSYNDRLDFAQSLAGHILETFNDSETITACHYRLVTEGNESLGQTT